jgi:aryl-alcohol dehydrogenase-like predicted oxidoreductase
MKKRCLGKTGMEVSEIAFGGVEIGMPYGIGVKSSKDMPSSTEAVYLLHTAIDEGINFFDTARLYGESEVIMGKAFKDRRENVILETKCRHLRDTDGKVPSHRELKQFIETSLKESLKALQTDYLDVFMLHYGDEEILQNEEVANAFLSLKKSGVIRATGVSVYTPQETSKAIEANAWDVIQLPFNLMDQRQKTLFPLAAEKGIGIVIRSVLLKGLLSDRGKNLHPALKDVENHIQCYNDLLGETAPDLPTLATKFALSFEEISSVLVGIDRLDYLYKSIQATSGDQLCKETVAKAKALAYPNPDFLNLHEWDVKGWLK